MEIRYFLSKGKKTRCMTPAPGPGADPRFPRRAPDRRSPTRLPSIPTCILASRFSKQTETLQGRLEAYRRLLTETLRSSMKNRRRRERQSDIIAG